MRRVHTQAGVHRSVHTQAVVRGCVHTALQLYSGEHIATPTHRCHSARSVSQACMGAHSHTRSPHAHAFQVRNSRPLCDYTNTHVHMGTVEFVSTGLLSASKKINVLLSERSCRPHKSRLLGSWPSHPTPSITHPKGKCKE